MSAFNARGVAAIYLFEMARFNRTFWQSLVAPVITTSLYFIVFGAAIGSRMGELDGVHYGAFIVPGLIMLSVLTESLNNASFGISTGTVTCEASCRIAGPNAEQVMRIPSAPPATAC